MPQFVATSARGWHLFGHRSVRGPGASTDSVPEYFERLVRKTPDDFRSLLARSGADILLLDEVALSTNVDQLRQVLAEPDTWQMLCLLV